MIGYLTAFILTCSMIMNVGEDPINYIEISIELINRLEKKEAVTDLVEVLAVSSEEAIYKQIKTDKQKYAFWVNIYNAYIQIILTENPDLYEDRNKFFKKSLIEIAGRTYSFAEIEHGILRRSQMGLFLGYVTNPFPPRHEKRLRVEERDFRIHFVLNCGAKSCPPVAAYTPEDVDKAFDYMTQQYLENTTVYNEQEDSYQVTALFSWFRGDFDGSSGIRDILQNFEVTSSRPDKLTTLPYDWTLDLYNYKEIPLDQL